MAICEQCRAEMTSVEARSCIAAPIEFPDGTRHLPTPYGEELHYADDSHDPPRPSAQARRQWLATCVKHRCHDCGVAAGGTHHPGCDMEECPRCYHQLLSCGCLDPEEVTSSRLLH